MAELQAELNRLAGTTGLDAQGAANAYAGTTGLDLVGALNVRAGTQGLELQGVLNRLAGTTGLGVNAAAGRVPLLSTAVAYWKAATYSGSGALQDGSGNGHHLTITGAAFDTDHFTLVASENDYLETADHANLDFAATDNFTIAVALKIAGAPAGTTAWMAKRASASASPTGAGYALVSSASSLVGRFIVDDGTAAASSTKSAAFAADTRVLLAGVRNVTADNITTYSNASSGTAVTDATTATLANAGVLRIGRLAGAGSGYADMTFYGAAIFRRALTATDLAEVATALGV